MEWRKASVKEINAIKRIMLEKIYDSYLSQYHGNPERCTLLCQAAGATFNSVDPSESLKEVFKVV